MINRKYECTLSHVSFYPAVNGNIYTQTPKVMRGRFQYEGYAPFIFKAFFCPMGGVWLSIIINGKEVPTRGLERWQEDDIGGAAMSIACNIRGKPEDEIQWTVSHTYTTTTR